MAFADPQSSPARLARAEALSDSLHWPRMRVPQALVRGGQSTSLGINPS
jgi:hypothetical protein